MDACTAGRSQAERRSTIPLWIVGAALLGFFLFAPSASANTTLFTDTRICSTGLCQALSYYGVYQNGGSTLSITGNWNVSDIGVNTGVDLSKTGTTNTVSNSIVDFADTVVSNSNCASGNFCGSGTLKTPGGATITPSTSNASRVTTAGAQLDSILTLLSGYNTGTPGAFTAGVNGSTTTVNVQTTPGNLKIYRNTSNYTQAGAITLGCGGSTCNANDLVLIILAGAGTSTLKFNINLADSLTSDQVIFYVPTGTLAITPNVGTETVNGSFFLAGNTTSTIGAGTGSNQVALNGHVYADLGALTFNNRGGTQVDLGEVPEPSTWAFLASGLGVILWVRSRSRKNVSSDASSR